MSSDAEVTVEVIERQVAEGYDSAAGKVVHLTNVEGYDRDDDSVTIHCDPPVVARIEAYADGASSDSILRWMDDENCDPVYSVSILEHHDAFVRAGVRPSWTYGTCRSTTAEVDPAPFVVADGAMQARFRDIECIDYGSPAGAGKNPSAVWRAAPLTPSARSFECSVMLCSEFAVQTSGQSASSGGPA